MTNDNSKEPGFEAVAPLAEEVDDNSIDAAQGGTAGTGPISAYAGNEGYVCTLTLECQKSCQPS